MIVAILNTKGGVGKTTAALNLVTQRAIKGRKTLAIDGDRQGSLIAAMAQREGVTTIAAAHYTEGKILRQQVELARGVYDDIVIDAGGRDSSALRASLAVADIVLVPFQPRSFDVWALDDMIELLEEARGARDIRAFAFLSLADPRGKDNAEAAAAAPAGLEYLACPIGRRKAVADAAGRGLGIIEARGDAKACVEFAALENAIFR